MMPITKTLGELNANDLGRTVELTDGGSTHAGTLTKIHHETSAIRGIPQSMVVLTSGDWRHVKSYPSETIVAVTGARAEA